MLRTQIKTYISPKSKYKKEETTLTNKELVTIITIICSFLLIPNKKLLILHSSLNDIILKLSQGLAGSISFYRLIISLDGKAKNY